MSGKEEEIELLDTLNAIKSFDECYTNRNFNAALKKEKLETLKQWHTNFLKDLSLTDERIKTIGLNPFWLLPTLCQFCLHSSSWITKIDYLKYGQPANRSDFLEFQCFCKIYHSNVFDSFLARQEMQKDRQSHILQSSLILNCSEFEIEEDQVMHEFDEVDLNEEI